MDAILLTSSVVPTRTVCPTESSVVKLVPADAKHLGRFLRPVQQLVHGLTSFRWVGSGGTGFLEADALMFTGVGGS